MDTISYQARNRDRERAVRVLTLQALARRRLERVRFGFGPLTFVATVLVLVAAYVARAA